MSNRSKRRELQRNLKKGKGYSKLDLPDLLYHLKYSLNYIQASKLLEGLSPEQIAYVNGNLFPKKINEIRSIGSTYTNNEFSKEIEWYTEFIISNQEHINKFLINKSEFERDLLKGDFENASKILDRVEDTISISDWSLGNRILITELQNGFKANKQLLASFVNDGNDPLTDIILQHYSIRVEQDLSHFKYEDMIEGYKENYDNDELTEYLTYKLNFYDYYDYGIKGFILNFENNASLIDRFLNFRTCCIMAICSEKSTLLEQDLIRKAFLKISNKINDNSFINSLYGLGENPAVSKELVNHEFIKCLDLYTEGRYNETLALSTKLLLEYPDLFDLYSIHARATINSDIELPSPFDKESLAHKTLEDVYNITLKNKNTNKSFRRIYKTFNSIGLNPWSYKCFTFFLDEHTVLPENFDHSKFSLLYSNFINPVLSATITSKEHSLKYLNVLNNIIPNSTTVEFWIRICEGLIEKGEEFNLDATTASDYRKLYYDARLDQHHDAYELAIAKYKGLENNGNLIEVKNQYHKEELLFGQLFSYLKLKDYYGAVKLLVERTLRNKYLKSKFHWGALLNAVIERRDEKLTKDIVSPILLHMNDESTNKLWIAYDNFLCSLGLNYAHELKHQIEDFDRLELIYFLHNVAVQDVYYNSYMFENQDDLDNERIEVCLILATLDEENAKTYRAEISEISRNLLIREGIKQIDESKIFADVTGIQEVLEEDLKESFFRSLNMLDLPIEQIAKLDTSKDNVIVPYYSKSKKTGKVELEEKNIKITNYNRVKQFADMFLKIRDKFIASNEFGIDTYLSMRIRHGTLLGEIRSVFENHHLITKKSGSGEYLPNSYWSEKLALDDALEEEFTQFMAKFSSQIDSLSDELKNKWLQINTEKRDSDGLFDYSYSEKELINLFKIKFGAIDDFEEFFEMVIEELWDKTEQILTEIRSYITNEVKSKNIELLRNLLTKVELKIDKTSYPRVTELIHDITSCQTSIGTEFDKISQWFRRTNSKTINDFQLDLPVDASLVTLKRIYPEYNDLTLKRRISSKRKFEGMYFTQFTFLIQNLLENIIKHSKLASKELEIILEISEKDDNLVISITNNVSKEIELKKRNLKINETIEIINKDIGELTRSEGGTGYPKIKKILAVDFKRTSFRIRINEIGENRLFNSEISFPIIGLEKQIVKADEISIN